ncbi:MAG: HD domain-containing protein [Patescibacteria group bacterium]|nr:HD domain-containing protein [Patescibacteria group bacterium]
MNKLWEKHAALTAKVREDHLEQKAFGGHDITHALMVAQYATLITEDERTGELAWIAGMCHNTDRIFPEIRDEKLPSVKVIFIRSKVVSYLDLVKGIASEEQELVIEAVLEHHKKNSDADNPVTVVLKDADRLANIGVNNIVRSGQHYSNLLPFDPRYVTTSDPTATYRDPKTVLHDVRCSLEWESWLRMPKAKKLADRWFRLYEVFVKAFADQLEETGLLPYPFPQDCDAAYQQK